MASENSILKSQKPINNRSLQQEIADPNVLVEDIIAQQTSHAIKHSHSRQEQSDKEGDKHQSIPVIKITQNTHKLHLPHTEPVTAKGILIGSSDLSSALDCSKEYQLIGNFSGVFQFESNVDRKNLLIELGQTVYFEGTIQNISILKQKEMEEMKFFRGSFKGQFLSNDSNQMKQLRIEVKPALQYFLPTLVTIDLRRIQEIDLEKSSALIDAVLKIDIQLNEQVLSLIYNKKTQSFIKKKKLGLDFHRGASIVLPFYRQGDFDDETEQESEYEWDDPYQGIDIECEFDVDELMMSYQIRTIYTAEIDNSHGIFFAPFNLNILKMIINLHSIKDKVKNTSFTLNFSICDLEDQKFEKKQVLFNDLPIFWQGRRQQKIRAQIRRLTKINSLQLIDFGEYSIADNHLISFPFHKRAIMNKNTLISNPLWSLGCLNRADIFSQQEVKSVQENYQAKVESLKNNQAISSSIFELKQWEFLHVQIPIFKYPVIDMIGLFVPITILSVISMIIFFQESGVDYTDFTQLAKRIGSSCSLMIAYIALVPMVRANIPPSPSITLVEILIYTSTIPNFFAIISTLTTESIGVDQFYASYKPFRDGLFVASFAICCICSILLIITIAFYGKKDYRSRYTIKKRDVKTIPEMKSPSFIQYIQQVKSKRKEIIIEPSKLAQP